MSSFKILAGSGIAIVAILLTFNGCASPSEESNPAPVPQEAKNVEVVKLTEGKTSVDVVFFNVERDGKTLICSTKMGYNSGVGCFEKAKE